ncbi:hypothetical protein LCGC14_0769670 [marine sediment metagenome]|uniref:Uncharacterized protein n=1 Tax=marine sediment metagenome TaxID=412755 RepID=A0A0F9PYU5_9ZZZZ
MSKIGLIIRSKGLNRAKHAALKEQARRLGRIRGEVWQQYGSVNSVQLSSRGIRDQWLKEKRQFDVLANAWKETLRDAIDDIKANREAAKVLVRRAIKRHTKDEQEQKRLYRLLRYDEWTEDPYLRRRMRTCWRRGRNRTHDQIVVRSDHYTAFVRKGRAWILVPGLVRRSRIAIPLNTNVVPTKTLRLIVRSTEVEVHYSVDEVVTDHHGDRTLGVDKGYTEVLTDSDGDRHGTGLGGLLSRESDYLKVKYRRRSRIRAVWEKALRCGDDVKADRIARNNLGRKKLNRRSRRQRQLIRDVVFKAVHSVVDKAETIAVEDLTWSNKTKGKLPKNVNRRLAAWVKGCIAEALTSVSRRRSSTVVLVNAAYTSQVDPRTGLLTASRRGDHLYCHDGVVYAADEAAALNVLSRLSDDEIHLFMSARRVRQILTKRTQRHRSGLLDLDSKRGNVSALESELPLIDHI